MSLHGVKVRYLLYCQILLLFGCTSFNHNKKESSQINLLGDYAIEFIGDTSKANFKRFKSILTKNAKTVNTLVISSDGGDVFSGMNIGKLVYQYHLKVIVQESCASSCANYIVTASNNVKVKKGALLGWHGGAMQTMYFPLGNRSSFFDKVIAFFNLVDNKKSMADFMKKWRSEESIFFKTVNVNQAITILGMMPGLKEKRDAMLFSYDKKTLKSLGTNIQFEDEKQQEYSKNGQKIVQVFNLSNKKLTALLKLHLSLIGNTNNTSKQEIF